jgi:hypothetical protein
MTLHLSLLPSLSSVSLPELARYLSDLPVLLDLPAAVLRGIGSERQRTSSDNYNSASILTKTPGIRENSGRKRDPDDAKKVK